MGIVLGAFAAVNYTSLGLSSFVSSANGCYKMCRSKILQRREQFSRHEDRISQKMATRDIQC